MNLQLNDLKIAIVYDKINKFGGAERVLLTLHEMFPNAPLYTSVYDEKNSKWAEVFPNIYTSFLQNIPFAKKHNEWFAWLMPIAFESFYFNNYDLVISVTSEAAKGIITNTNALHVCYMLTPTRYLWSGYEEYFKNKILKFISLSIIKYLKLWDIVAAKRPDKIIAISTEVQKRIKKYYGRDSEIIFPPVELTSYPSLVTGERNYYLYVGRLVRYKKVDLLVETFNDLDLPLIIVGVGPELNKLKASANANIKFLGYVSDNELPKIYQNAKAFLMPQIEDFGITSVEAQSFGVPVITYKLGGAIDTVVDEVTGIYFEKQVATSLKQAIAKFDTIIFNDSYIKENAKKFEGKRFKRELQRSLIRVIGSWRRRDKALASIKEQIT